MLLVYELLQDSPALNLFRRAGFSIFKVHRNPRTKSLASKIAAFIYADCILATAQSRLSAASRTPSNSSYSKCRSEYISALRHKFRLQAVPRQFLEYQSSLQLLLVMVARLPAVSLCASGRAASQRGQGRSAPEVPVKQPHRYGAVLHVYRSVRPDVGLVRRRAPAVSPCCRWVAVLLPSRCVASPSPSPKRARRCLSPLPARRAVASAVAVAVGVAFAAA